jgi:signal transduction histidine kinase
MLVLGGIGLLCAFGVVAGGALAALAHRREVVRHEQTGLQLQEAQSVSKQRGDILAAASHDLRNPLGAIVLAADVLKESAKDTGDADLSSLADQVAAAAQRTAMLVSDLLDFTRVEAGRLVIERRRLDPLEVVNEAIADMRLWRPSQVVEVEANSDRRASLEGDPKRLRAAIRNLLENACQYAQAPYRVRVLDTDEVVEIHVEDAGPGIPPDERAGVFEQFHRGTTSAGREGTGIGLYMCRGIVELHGGKLEIDDSPLGGSDFVCRMPAAAMA